MARCAILPSSRESHLPEEWLRHAQSDLNLAQLARSRPDVLAEQICFHAQQAAEKALKAVLLHRGVSFPLTHDIEELLELAEHGELAIPSEVARSGSLTPYAVETRYPGSLEAVGPGHVEEAIRIADAAVRWAALSLRT